LDDFVFVIVAEGQGTGGFGPFKFNFRQFLEKTHDQFSVKKIATAIQSQSSPIFQLESMEDSMFHEIYTILHASGWAGLLSFAHDCRRPAFASVSCSDRTVNDDPVVRWHSA